MSVQAIGILAVSVGIPMMVSALFPVPILDPTGPAYPVVGNVLAMACLCFILVGCLGRLWGSLAFIAIYWGLVLLPGEAPALAVYSPRTFYMGVDQFQGEWRWWWHAVLLGGAFWTAWRRRMVPVVGTPR